MAGIGAPEAGRTEDAVMQVEMPATPPEIGCGLSGLLQSLADLNCPAAAAPEAWRSSPPCGGPRRG